MFFTDTETLNSETSVLTANRRLAEIIRREYDQRQQNNHRQVWDTPTVIPLRAWLQFEGRSLLETDHLLTAAQEQQIWSDIIQENCHEDYPLLQVEGTARLAQQAWEMLNLWEIPLSKLETGATSLEATQFVHWARQFMDRCERRHWLSESLLPKRLREQLPPPQKIILAGFDELPPAYTHLLTELTGCDTLTELKQPHRTSQLYPRIGPDLESEIMQMAQWAKDQYEKNPHQSIGCVVPQLTKHRAMIVRILTQLFTPESLLPGVRASPPPFNISGGQRLDQFEMISTALQTLAMRFGKISLEDLGYLFQSPYLCQNENDINLGALLDAECRQTGGFELPLTELFKVIARCQTHYPGQTWLHRWRLASAISHECADKRQLPSAWAYTFTRQLTAFGWPGGRSLNSLEYQLTLRWQELLLELAELDLVSGEMPRAQALNCLRRLAAQTIFQSQTETDKPIQILGVLESSGFNFDALWVMGLSDSAWPPHAQPNPFLPYDLQIELQMPHASMQREFIYTQKITQRLLHSAEKIWVSCSADQPGQTVRFSRLIPLEKAPEKSEHFKIAGYADKIFAASRKERFDDDQGPAVTDMKKIRGGASILTRQAECPFRAFAIYRLNAIGLQNPQLGISPRQHGNLVHAALDSVWQILKNQQNLLAMNEAELQSLIKCRIEGVIDEAQLKVESTFILSEKNRLTLLLNEWLMLEKKRPPFEILAQETQRNLELSGLKLQIKIDRIDQLSDGHQLIIDYKTGESDPKKWLHPRLTQPQLPLYAYQQHVAGMAFGQLQIGKSGFKGLHDESLDTRHYFPAGINSVDKHSKTRDIKTWLDLVTFWCKILEKLAAEFVGGHAMVAPADDGAPCKTCDLQALCRVKGGTL